MDVSGVTGTNERQCGSVTGLAPIGSSADHLQPVSDVHQNRQGADDGAQNASSVQLPEEP
jgi:hypothetical protein